MRKSTKQVPANTSPIAQAAAVLAGNPTLPANVETDEGDEGEGDEGEGDESSKLSRRQAERARIAAGTGKGARFQIWAAVLHDLAESGVAQATFKQVSDGTAAYTRNGKALRANNTSGESLSSWRGTIREAQHLGWVPSVVSVSAAGFDLSSHPAFAAKAPSKAPSKAAKAAKAAK